MNKNLCIALIFVACYLVNEVHLQATAESANTNLPEFVILVTSYNNEKYARRNFESLLHQRTQSPYEIICVDDASSDLTGKIMDRYAAKYDSDRCKIKIIHNKERTGSALENIYNTIHNHIADHKIVVCVDGDDYLSQTRVLERLEKEYVNPQIWMTYGRFIVYPKCEFWSNCWGYPEEVIANASFRKHHNVPSHLKTFKAGLFKKIKKSDLLDQDGQFYRKSWDMAMLFPMLEMSAPADESDVNHSSFVADTVLYIYNWENPISDGRNDAGRQEQIALDRQIRAKEPYEPLGKL